MPHEFALNSVSFSDADGWVNVIFRHCCKLDTSDLADTFHLLADALSASFRGEMRLSDPRNLMPGSRAGDNGSTVIWT